MHTILVADGKFYIGVWVKNRPDMGDAFHRVLAVHKLEAACEICSWLNGGPKPECDTGKIELC